MASPTRAIHDVEGAKKYLVKHNLHSVFEDLAADVIAERPEDPIAFLLKKMQQMVDDRAKGANAEQERKDADARRKAEDEERVRKAAEDAENAKRAAEEAEVAEKKRKLEEEEEADRKQKAAAAEAEEEELRKKKQQEEEEAEKKAAAAAGTADTAGTSDTAGTADADAAAAAAQPEEQPTAGKIDYDAGGDNYEKPKEEPADTPSVNQPNTDENADEL